MTHTVTLSAVYYECALLKKSAGPHLTKNHKHHHLFFYFYCEHVTELKVYYYPWMTFMEVPNLYLR